MDNPEVYVPAIVIFVIYVLPIFFVYLAFKNGRKGFGWATLIGIPFALGWIFGIILLIKLYRKPAADDLWGEGTKGLKIILQIMNILFILAIVIVSIGLLLTLIFRSGELDFHDTLIKWIILWFAVGIPIIPITYAIKQKKNELEGLGIPQSRRIFIRVLLSIVFIVYIGVPLIIGGGYLLLKAIDLTPGAYEFGKGPSGGEVVPGAYVDVPDSAFGIFAALLWMVIAVLIIVYPIISLLRFVLLTINRDY